MNKIKQKFSELRKSTPRRVQWLLLGAAFVVTLILLTVLLSEKSDNSTEIATANAAPAELKIAPDMINWADVIVGEKKEQKIKINATAPVIIKDVQRYDDINGYSLLQACVGQVVDANIACDIIVTYAPSTPTNTTQTSIVVMWHKKDESEDMARQAKIVLTLGAKAPVIEEPITQPAKASPAPVEMPEITDLTGTPAPEVYDIFQEDVTPETIQEEIVREIEAIAPPVKVTERTNAKKEIIIPDGCSDFAFPAYNNAGRQIGWVKPSGGAYYYHTFADKNCTEPSGKYNPDNGIITDDSGKKIGTDADHIGFTAITSGELPQLSNIPAIKPVNRAKQSEILSKSGGMARLGTDGMKEISSGIQERKFKEVQYGTSGDGTAIVASQPYDRSFVLRQYKPIPATIVSEVRADAEVYQTGKPLPVRATVDRNVYSDDGRNIIVPAGTLMLGYVTGNLPGPYKAIGRMQIQWYQFIRPDGVEFNFDDGNMPFAGDSQGRVGVPGRGSTDYLEQFFMPMLTAVVPAAVNLIAPISDRFVNQIDLDNNTVVQSGTVRSSELAKNEIITAWNQVAQKLMVDMMDNTVPPFTIAAGTRITVYSPEDLIVVCPDKGKSCNMTNYYAKSMNQKRFDYNKVANSAEPDYKDGSWVGQVRSFAVSEFCTEDGDVVDDCKKNGECGGYDYRTILFYCQANQYKAINMARQDAVYQNQQDSSNKNSIAYIQQQGPQTYNEQVLGLTYDEETGAIENPFTEPAPPPAEEVAATETLLCLDNTEPDANGCCTGEIYTDMGDQGFNCCPETGGDCFPPMF